MTQLEIVLLYPHMEGLLFGKEEKGDGNFPYSKFVFDTLRASYICDTAEDMVKAYRALLKSEVFDVVRMKNKIGRDKGPFNLHVNVMFKLEKCEDPILCEVQIYPRRVFELQHRQHLQPAQQSRPLPQTHQPTPSARRPRCPIR